MPPEHPVVTAHHGPDVHLETLLVVRVPTRRGDRAGDAEEPHARNIVGEHLGLALRERVLLPPAAAQCLLQLGEMVDDLDARRVGAADGFQRVEKRVFRELLGRSLREEGDVGGRSPELESGDARRVEHSVDRPCSQDPPRFEGRRVGFSAADRADRGGDPQILGEPPEQSDGPRSIGRAMNRTIDERPSAMLGLVQGGFEVADVLADDLLPLSMGAPLLEVGATVPPMTLDRHVGARWHLQVQIRFGPAAGSR